ncbi:MAG: type II toxin-antitoxin system HicA family toxin [Candidatus Aminicenantes bacterium]|nr:type II toxin-antitoxin system HicA family toxin [Candidatus Aminicenantes bacterium]
MKYQKIPALTGLELIRLLKKDGWIEHRQATHGIALVKRFKEGTKITIVPKTKANLPVGTLMAILGEKQTGLGKKGLLGMLNIYG